MTPGRAHPKTAADAAPHRTLLIVDYDVGVRTTVAAYLRACGYRVLEANGVAAALSFLESDTRIDVVFSEVELAGPTDGFTLAQWVRRSRPGVEVLLTGTPKRMAEQASNLCSVGEILHKPYEHDELERRIRSMVRRAEERRPQSGQTRG